MTLWYQQPARMWTEALPVGNAHLGAMVYGGIATERVQLNEDTLWDGYPIDRINPKALTVLPEVRKDIFEGKTPEATKLIADNMMGVPARIRSYQTLGNLNLDSPDIKNATNYRRSLDLSTGLATTQYTVDGTGFTREVFASHPDNVIVLHLTADKPGQISLSPLHGSAKKTPSPPPTTTPSPSRARSWPSTSPAIKNHGAPSPPA